MEGGTVLAFAATCATGSREITMLQEHPWRKMIVTKNQDGRKIDIAQRTCGDTRRSRRR